MPNTTLFGLLGVAESDLITVNSIGQGVVYGATVTNLNEHNLATEVSLSPFVDHSTELYDIKYRGHAGGRLQRRGPNSPVAEVRPAPTWRVGLPLEDFAASMGANDVDMAYMTLKQWADNTKEIIGQDRNTMRFEVLRALFNNTARVVKDRNFPDVTVQPLASGDATLYPPVQGAETTATSNHYLGVASANSVLSDAVNPIPRIVDLLEGHYGVATGGEPIVIFINNAQTIAARGLAGFSGVTNLYVTPGANTATVTNYPEGLPGRVVGECNGALIVEWRFVPANYLLGIHLGAPKPLLRRVDLAMTGLLPGLQLVAKDYEFPIETSTWRNRCGFGVGERTNGVIVDLATGSDSYTVPARFA